MATSWRKSLKKRLRGLRNPSGWLRSSRGQSDAEGDLKLLKTPPKGNNGIVLYYTSSRVIRKTYAECSAVYNILKSLDLPFQERDAFISRRYLLELREIFGSDVGFPQLFVGGKHVGGFHTIIELSECGKLDKMVAEYINERRASRVCKLCGDLRYLVCFVCNGSRRFYEEEGGETVACNICNENGLVPCPDCFF